MAQTAEPKFDAIESSLAALKAINDPAVQAEAEKLKKNVKEIISINKPMVVSHTEQMKAFDAGIVAKCGVPAARLIEFGLMVVTAKDMSIRLSRRIRCAGEFICIVC